MRYLLRKETEDGWPGDYLNKQPEMTPLVREVLIDWMVDVAVKFHLGTETLFLAVNYLDRYLATATISRHRLQLLGTCCLMMAAKLEEIYPPRLDDFAIVTDGACSKGDLLAMEQQVLTALDFKLTASTVLRFFLMFTKIVGLSAQALMTGRYLCELAISKYDSVDFAASQVAAGAIYLVGRLFDAPVEWPAALEKASGLSLSQVRTAAKPIYLALLSTRLPHSCSAVKRKYASEKYLQVSLLKVDHHGSKTPTMASEKRYKV